MSVYNGADRLADSIASILEQDGVGFEFIIVDDGSTDATPEILARFAAQDARIRLLSQWNQGLTRALIRGCALARGEFIARQDAGDVSLPGRLALQAAALERQAELAFLACRWDLLGPDDELLVEDLPAVDAARMAEGLQSGDEKRLAGPHHGAVMMRRSAYEASGGYRVEFYFAQDLDLWSRLIRCGGFALVPQKLYRARFGPRCISARYRSQQQDLKRLIAKSIRLRAADGSDGAVQERAAGIRPIPRAADTAEADLADYFIGSCLFRRSDGRARRYLRAHLAARPADARAWLKLAWSHLRHSDAVTRTGGRVLEP
jgi:glycosyltransferase involved in cell wall biosynthesis